MIINMDTGLPGGMLSSRWCMGCDAGCPPPPEYTEWNSVTDAVTNGTKDPYPQDDF